MRPGDVPPPDYYADLLLHVLVWVFRRHGDLLRCTDRAWASKVMSLDADAQRLYVRLLLRRPRLIRRDRIAYREVANVDAALARLSRRGLVALDPWVEPATLLELARADELRAWWPEHAGSGIKRTQLITRVAARCTSAQIAARLAESIHWCQPLGRLHLQRFLLGYFGRRRTGMSDFITADLGIVRFEQYSVTAHRLASAPDADAYLEFGRLERSVCELAGSAHIELAADLARVLAGWAHSAASETRLAALRTTIGRALERAGHARAALRCYAEAGTSEALVRSVRLLRRQGQRLEASALAVHLAADGCDDTTRESARRWLGCGTTLDEDHDEVLWLAPDPSHAPRGVEEAALAVYRARGFAGAHCENRLIGSLFGLLFWDIVFAPCPGAFSHPYQSAPLDLYSAEFFERRREIIHNRLAAIRSGRAEHMLAAVWYARFGVSNALVSWSLPWSLLLGVIRRLPAAVLARLLEHIARDPSRACRGWPDLVLLGGSCCRFVEVKGPGDALRPEQRLWLGFLQSLGLRAGVAWVHWQ